MLTYGKMRNRAAAGPDRSAGVACRTSCTNLGLLRFAGCLPPSIRAPPSFAEARRASLRPSRTRSRPSGNQCSPLPPAGLFVVEERTVYLRNPTPMTIAHEFAHGLDCALGGGVYRSGYDRKIRRAFANARDFVTPYAASGLDEYFAECVRAYVEVNDTQSPWPRATRERLSLVDPAMSALVAGLFANELR